MVCKKCGAETLVEGAVYCASCGSRLDGKIQCGNCKQFNDASNAFCVFCGTRIDGKTVCKGCGELVEGAFCAHCGTAVSAPQKTGVAEKSVNSNKQKLWDKIFGLTSGGVALLGTLFAMIFVFLIGFVAKVTGSEEAVKGMVSTEAVNIYHFFGDAYKEIDEIKEAFQALSTGGMQISNMYLHTVVCTVLVVLTLGCVVGFAIPAVITYVKYATGKTEKINSKWALLSIFSFLGGLAMLYAQHYTKANIAISEEAAKAVIKPNGVTIAGVILCAVFAGLWLVTKLVSYGNEWKNKQFVKKAVCITLAAGFLSAILVVWQKLTLGTELIIGEEKYVMAGTIGTNFAPGLNNTYFLTMMETMLSNSLLAKHEVNLVTVYACNIVMLFVSIGGVACIIGCLQSRVSATEGKNYTGLAFSISLFALAVLALVLFIVMQTNMQTLINVALDVEGVEISLETNYKYGVCIATMILAGLNLAVSITHTVFKKQKTE